MKFDGYPRSGYKAISVEALRAIIDTLPSASYIACNDLGNMVVLDEGGIMRGWIDLMEDDYNDVDR
jgi:hypothetical protein